MGSFSHQQKYFNSIADHYQDSNLANIEFLERSRDIISPFIKGRVLDIGSGGIINYDYKKAESILLTDIAIDLLKMPKTIDKDKFVKVRLNKISVKKANVMDLRLKNGFFDIVIMLNVAHHLSVNSKLKSQKNVDKAISEINKVLKLNGSFIFQDNCPTLIFKFVFDLFYEPTFFLLNRIFRKPLPYFFSENQLKKYLQKNKFKIIYTFDIGWGRKTYQPILPWFSPPGWLWNCFLKNKLFLAVKIK